jgi:hypothetical protein
MCVCVCVCVNMNILGVKMLLVFGVVRVKRV